MDPKGLSIEMAKRLKEERQRKKLSHVALSKLLKATYGIEISKDSLQNYEVSTESHTKSFTNNGMRVEYLRCLADFYDVSTDYLLGLTDIRSRNETVKDIHSKTGLSQAAIVRLMDDRELSDTPYIPFLNQLIENNRLPDLSALVTSYTNVDKDQSIRLDMIPVTDGLDDYHFQASAFLKALLTEYFFMIIEGK